MTVYLDNAATTAIDPEVVSAMVEVMEADYGNPSSIHGPGRKAKTHIERTRKLVAGLLDVSPGEILFTSGGTEADNMAIRCAVHDYGVERIITSPLEHHAVLHSIDALENVEVIELNVAATGEIDYDQLAELLTGGPKTLVSLMHGNNEIGVILDIERVGALCRVANALFHSDTVQTIGYLPVNYREIGVHYATCSAHKFHGPKGVGFLYMDGDMPLKPLLHGGAQERNLRGGTENIYGIVGLGVAFEKSRANWPKTEQHLMTLKSHLHDRLKTEIPGVKFNGVPDLKASMPTVLNVGFPPSEKAEMLLFNLDIAGFAVSAGSACTSGSDQGSHVLKAIGVSMDQPSLRFSFSKYNTMQEIDALVEELKLHL